MRKEIYNNRDNDSTTWVTITRGAKYLTLKYHTMWQGGHDITIRYNLTDEAELMETVNHPLFSIDCITDAGWGPKPVKTIIHKPVA